MAKPNKNPAPAVQAPHAFEETRKVFATESRRYRSQ